MKKNTILTVIAGLTTILTLQAHPADNVEKTEPSVQKAETSAKAYIPSVKIALLLDTSNSMDGLINQAKSRLWDIVNEFTYARCDGGHRPKLEIALYQYGNDYLSAGEGYVQQVLGFSSDLDKISEKLFSLTTNGGEEYCGVVVSKALRQLDWGKQDQDLKFIFIAGNEPFNQGNLPYEQVMKDAVEKDVIVNTIFCGNYDQGIHTFWKKGAHLAKGDYSSIDHNRQIVHIKTPYDQVIIKLNQRLNKTYVTYGSEGRSRYAAQEVQDMNAMELEEEVAVKRAVSKSSAYYNNSQWDLVDAVEANDSVLEKVSDEHLPSELKGKSKKEIAAYVQKKQEERKSIQEEIRKVNAEREAYIAKNKPEEGDDDLKMVLVKMIRKQGAQKNLSWDQ